VTARHDRGPKMPLHRPIILNPSDEAEWLNPTTEDVNTLYGLMRPTSDDMLEIHRVTPDVKSMKADSPQLILPIA